MVECILLSVADKRIENNRKILLPTVAVYENVRLKIIEFNNNYKTIKR